MIIEEVRNYDKHKIIFKGGKMKGRYYGLIILALVFFLSPWGCGGGGTGGAGGNDAPPESTITINPSSISVTGLSGDTTFNLTVIVKDSKGNPINNAQVTISGPFAAPRVPARYQFYNQPNGVGPVNSSFTGQTNEFGTYSFSIIIPALVGGVANAFTDNIQVSSGNVSASVAVTLSL